MKSNDYLKLSKKENKTKVEMELLRATKTLRIISENVTDASKGQLTKETALSNIRLSLNQLEEGV